jgi:branched-chain amino acid transport system substrate-binding protein
MSIRARALVATVVLSSLALAACGSRAAEQPPSGPATGAASANTASDTGVSPTEIKVGLMAGLTSGLGPDTFSGSLYGAKAYFDALNAAGGVNGRKIKLVECDDQGTGDGNVACVHRLIDDEKVFAFAGTTAFNYAGAPYVNSKDVPDIGGQPVSNAYDQYPHLYSIYGSFGYPRDGKTIGFDGKLTAGTGSYRWFKQKLGTQTAAVVYYNVAPSQRYAQSIIAGLQKEGFKVIPEEINLGLPNWDAAVSDMRSRGVDLVYDAMDDGGNGKLCSSIQSQGLALKGKVITAQGWTDNVASLYKSSPTCLNALYATGVSRNYNDVLQPSVAAFQTAVKTYVPDRANKLSIWMLEGYAAAQWLTDAAKSCGADLTRACVETYMNRPVPYDGHGLLIPRDFTPVPAPPATEKDCMNVVRYTQNGPGGKPGWATQVADMNTNCFNVPVLSYSAE